jgi:hypothetical protein
MLVEGEESPNRHRPIVPNLAGQRVRRSRTAPKEAVDAGGTTRRIWRGRWVSQAEASWGSGERAPVTDGHFRPWDLLVSTDIS